MTISVWVLIGLSGEPDIVQDYEPEGWEGVDYGNGYGSWSLDDRGSEVWYKLPFRSKEKEL